MRLPRPSALLLCCTLAKAGPTSRDQPPPSSTNILDYVDSFPYDTGDKCSAVITSYGDDHYLAYPNARIVHQSSGTIDCQTRLRLAASQTGYRFSVDWVSLSGHLQLEPGAYIERINVSLSYYPGGGSQVDVATARSLYGKGGTGYDGRFNLSIPVTPGGSGGRLGTTGCRSSTGDQRTWITAYVFVSLAHEMIEFDEFTPHYGTVGGDSADKQLTLGLEGFWEKC